MEPATQVGVLDQKIEPETLQCQGQCGSIEPHQPGLISLYYKLSASLRTETMIHINLTKTFTK